MKITTHVDFWVNFLPKPDLGFFSDHWSHVYSPASIKNTCDRIACETARQIRKFLQGPDFQFIVVRGDHWYNVSDLLSV